MAGKELQDKLSHSGSTKQELLFLKHLGDGSWTGAHPLPDRKRMALLCKYREAAMVRDSWGRMNKKQILGYIDNLRWEKDSTKKGAIRREKRTGKLGGVGN